MGSGNVGALLVYDCNPVYSIMPMAKNSETAIAKLPLSVSFNTTLDETSEQCKYLIPSHHWLESWGDAEPKTGYISLIQPIINPLFKTREFQTSLLKWSGDSSTLSSVKDSLGVVTGSAISTNDYADFVKITGLQNLEPQSCGKKHYRMALLKQP